MNDLMLRIAIVTAFLAGVYTTGYYYGNKHATERYKPPMEACEAREQVAKEEGERLKKEWEKANAKWKTTYYTDVDILTKRLLELDMQGQASCTATEHTKEADGSTKERTFTTTIEKCALDAQQVLGWQEWAREHNLPLSP